MDLYSSNPLQDIESMLFSSFSPEPFPIAPALPEVPWSSFAPSIRPASSGCSSSGTIMRSDRNAQRRMIEFLRRIPRSEPAEDESQNRGSRGFRHMMRERQRREKMSQCYADLHSILPYVPKGDKNSIVQSAAAYIKDLEKRKEELRRHNEELRKTDSTETNNNERSRIKIRAENPMSNLDSMISALQCLKAMDAKATAICSEFSGCELTVVVDVNSNSMVGAHEVQRAVERAFVESWR